MNNLLDQIRFDLAPTISELGYDDSLELFYNHYPYGWSNNNNVILVDGHFNVIAIQYNGVKDNNGVNAYDYIMSVVPIKKDYIVYNNKYKIKTSYKKIEEIEKEFPNLFSN